MTGLFLDSTSCSALDCSGCPLDRGDCALCVIGCVLMYVIRCVRYMLLAVRVTVVGGCVLNIDLPFSVPI